MHRIDGAGHASNTFTKGDPLTATPATVVTDDWLNAVQEELSGFIEAAGVTLVKGTNNQLQAAAVKKNGDTMTGDLSVIAATSRTILIRATDNSAHGKIQVEGKTAGGVTVQGQLVADGAGTVNLKAVSNHPLRVYSNDVHVLSISPALLTIENGGTKTVHHDGNSPRFESSEIAIPGVGSITTVAHSLGVRPRKVWAVLRCKTTDQGYAVDDEVNLGHLPQDSGMVIGADATNCLLVRSGTGANWKILHKSTFGQVDVTAANWRLVLRANP